MIQVSFLQLGKVNLSLSPCLESYLFLGYLSILYELTLWLKLSEETNDCHLLKAVMFLSIVDWLVM